MTDELEEAWAVVHAATPDGWYVGRPSEHPERRERIIFAFDTRERAVEGKRAGEWTTVAPVSHWRTRRAPTVDAPGDHRITAAVARRSTASPSPAGSGGPGRGEPR